MFIDIDFQQIYVSQVRFDELYVQVDDCDSFIFAHGCLSKQYQSCTSSILMDLYNDFSCCKADQIFVGGYFIAIFNRAKKELRIMRDAMGQKTGYYYEDNVKDRIIVSTNMHKIAEVVSTDMDKFYTDFLLFQQYVPDGHTIYANISELPIGQTLQYKKGNGWSVLNKCPLPINFEENGWSEEKNIQMLREKILETHARYAGSNNVVYLSGGIDSNVMLAALHDICPKDVRTVSYRIAGTEQDETTYADEVASYLGYTTEIVTVSPDNPTIVANYVSDLLEMNNPFAGNWVFRPHLSSNEELRYFAGQDTRLHTPSVNKVDMYVFEQIAKGHRGQYLGKLIAAAYERMSCFLHLYNSGNRTIKYSHLLVDALCPELFVLHRKFMADPVKYNTWEYDMTNFQSICDWYHLDLKKGMTPREIFNRIVEKKWQEQYISDIGYMVDMGRLKGVSTLLPFYDESFNKFASTIPWDLANKTMTGMDGFTDKKVSVNKYVLRKAFEKELPWKLMSRAKAVSLSSHLMMNGVLGHKIEETLKQDLSSKESFCERFNYTTNAQEIINKANSWETKDAYLQGLANYLSALCVYYHKNVVKDWQ